MSKSHSLSNLPHYVKVKPHIVVGRQDRRGDLSRREQMAQIRPRVPLANRARTSRIERPLIRSDEPMTIEKDMNIVVHPTYMRGGMLSWFCDNWLIGPNGPGERLHHFPEALTELG